MTPIGQVALKRSSDISKKKYSVRPIDESPRLTKPVYQNKTRASKYVGVGFGSEEETSGVEDDSFMEKEAVLLDSSLKGFGAVDTDIMVKQLMRASKGLPPIAEDAMTRPSIDNVPVLSWKEKKERFKALLERHKEADNNFQPNLDQNKQKV